MRPDLMGYLLGALDGPEQERLKQQIDSDPQLQAQLEQLERTLAPMETMRWQEPAPVGLADRTCALVSSHIEKTKVQAQRLEQVDRSALWGQVQRTGWRLVDVAVAAGIVVATSMMFFPAIANSRYLARLTNCQNNLRHFGVALPAWADRSSGKLPYIEPRDPKTGVAGFYAPQLMTAGYVTEHNRFLCPSSNLAKQRNIFVVPSIKTIQIADGQRLVVLQRRMGGSYTYGLGHMANGKHRATVMRGRSYFPVMSEQRGSTGGTVPHGTRGINVLFEDGHLKFIVIRPAPGKPTVMNPELDQMFVNDQGMIAAGLSEEDAVLAPSWVRPIPAGTAAEAESTPSSTGVDTPLLQDILYDQR